MKRIILIVGGALLLAFIALKTPDTDRDVMLGKYTNQYSGFISDDSGFNIHYRDQGNKAGKPIVLLHGSSGSLHVFEPLIDQIKGDYRLISYDHPGHGLTGPHPADDYSYKGFATALDLMRSELQLEQFILIGHSMGGWISWRYTVEHPESVRALILISASGMPDREEDPSRKESFGEQLLQTSVGGWLAEYIMPRRMVHSSTNVAIYDDDLVTDELVDQFWELMRFPGNRRAFAIRSKLGRDVHLADLAKSIKVPTLIIWGNKDPQTFPSATLSFSERIRHAEIVMLPDVGHLPMLEAPVDIGITIEQFLDRQVNSESNP